MGLNFGTINNLSIFITSLGVAFIVILWISLIIWVYRDIGKRSEDLPLRILAVTVAILLFLPGVLIYLILRPSFTIEEKYQAALEEEALLATIEESELCPGCERKINPDWMVCPSCHTILNRKCPGCGKVIELAWDICPYCCLEQTPQKRNHPATDHQ